MLRRSFPSRHAAAVLGSAVLIFAAPSACSDSTAPDGRVGIQFLAGADRSDTVLAVITQALVVEVRDSAGHRAPFGTLVRFDAIERGFFDPEAYVGALASQEFFSFHTEETDDNGRVAVLVKLGTKVGPARIIVSAPTLGLVDTAMYTALAGNPANISVTPEDTLLFVSGSYSAAAVVEDAYGNPRSDPVTWSANGTGISVTSAGVVTATALGRHRITATAGSAAGSGFVSVAPRLQLLAWRHAFDQAQVVTMDLDGTNQRVLAPVEDGGIGAHPRWMPGTNTVIYTTMEAGLQRLKTVDANGVISSFIASTPPTMSHQAEPTPSSDGNWIFFSAFVDACGSGGDYCIHRATKTGGSPTLLAAGFPSRQPAPSPDGSKVAFTRSDYSGEIQVLDIASSAISTWRVPGQHPSWSPLGTKIAYLSDGQIYLVNPDGTGRAQLTTSQERFYYSSPISWSQDAKWIIAQSSHGVIDLIDVATGAALPMPTTDGLSAGTVR
jgi:hypothetical protein